jgi:hypothetical protein
VSGFPGVESARVDLAGQQARLEVREGFDQYPALQAAVEAGGGAIRMFQARYLVPRQFSAAVGVRELPGDGVGRLQRRLQTVPGVRCAWVDPERWFRNDEGLLVGGALVFADSRPSLEDELDQSAQAAGFVLELRPDEPTMLAQKEDSEMSHAVAGLCMLCLAAVGVLLLALPKPPAALRYGTVAIFLAEFAFLVFRTDTSYWPMGPVNWWAGFHDPTAVQHRLGLGMLIPIALGDYFRVRRGWAVSPLLSGWGILIVGLVGGGMLLVHGHHTIDPAHAAAVRRVNAQHVAMGVSVILFGVSKFVWDTWQVPRPWGRYLHLAFLGLLGVILSLYVE